jgi:subtilisin-like proprotein convertase family protein
MKTLLSVFLLVFAIQTGFAQTPRVDCMSRKWFPHYASYKAHAPNDIYPGGHDGYDVIAYDLYLQVIPGINNLVGSATITLLATTDELSFIDLDFIGYAISSSSINGTTIASVRVGTGSDVLRLEAPSPIIVGSTAVVVVSYAGQPVPGDWFGLENGVKFHSDSVYLAGEPVGSRYLYPCNDRPDDKATYRVTTHVPAGYLVSGTGLLTASSTAAPTWSYTWETQLQVTTYAIAWAVGPYEQWNVESEPVDVLNYAFPDLVEEASFDFARIHEMINFFASQFGPYPFEKYGHALVKGNLILECQTMTTFSVVGITGNRKHEPTVAHELAHQWWGNSITPQSWADLWLNEGMASYCEILWVEHTDPERVPSYLERFTEEYNNFHREFQIAVGDPEPRFLFSPVVYKKGAWIFHMLRARMGDEAFFAAMKTYAAQNREGLGTTAKLRSVLEDASGLVLTGFFDYWIHDIGYPFFAAQWNAQPLAYGNKYRVSGSISQPGGEDCIRRDWLELRFTDGAQIHATTVEVVSGAAQWSWELPFAPTQLYLDPRDVMLDQSTVVDQRRHYHDLVTSGDGITYPEINRPLEFNVYVDEEFVVADVDVELSLEFPGLGKLRCTILPPNAGMVLFNGIGQPDERGTWMEGTVLDSQAPKPLVGAFPPYRGPRHPPGDLSSLAGISSRGTWRVQFWTLEEGLTGRIKSVRISILPKTPEAQLGADLNSDGRVNWLDLFIFAQLWNMQQQAEFYSK